MSSPRTELEPLLEKCYHEESIVVVVAFYPGGILKGFGFLAIPAKEGERKKMVARVSVGVRAVAF